MPVRVRGFVQVRFHVVDVTHHPTTVTPRRTRPRWWSFVTTLNEPQQNSAALGAYHLIMPSEAESLGFAHRSHD